LKKRQGKNILRKCNLPEEGIWLDPPHFTRVLTECLGEIAGGLTQTERRRVMEEVTKITFEKKSITDGDGWIHGGILRFYLKTGEIVREFADFEKQKCTRCGVVHPNSQMTGIPPICEKCKPTKGEE